MGILKELPIPDIQEYSVDMPKYGADYDTAKALFLKGLSFSKIAKQTSISYDALIKYASRNGWTALRDKSVLLMSEHVGDTLAARSTAHILKISGFAEQAIDNLIVRDLASMKLSDMESLARIADTFDRIARRTYGLDQIDASPRISLSVNMTNGEHTVLGKVIDLPDPSELTKITDSDSKT